MGKFPCGLFLMGKCPNMGDPSGCRRGPHNRDLAPFCETWARGECTGCYRRHYYLAEDNKLVAIKTEPVEARHTGLHLAEDNEVSLRFVVDFETGKRSFRSEHENTETLVSTENVRIYEYEVKNKVGSEVGGKLDCSSDSRASSCRDSKRSGDPRPNGREEDGKDKKMNKSRGEEEGEKRNKYKEDNRKISNTITDRKEGRKNDVRRHQQKEEKAKNGDLRKQNNVGSPRVELLIDPKKDIKLSSSYPLLPPPPSSRYKDNANLEKLGSRRKYSKPCDVPDTSGVPDDYNPTSLLKLFLGKEEERLSNVKIPMGQEQVGKTSDLGCGERDKQRINITIVKREGDRKVCDNMEMDGKIMKTRSIKRKISEDVRDRSKDRKFPKISENQDSIIRDDHIRDMSVIKDSTRERKVSKDRRRDREVSKEGSRDRKVSKEGSRNRKVSKDGSRDRKVSKDGIRDRKVRKDWNKGNDLNSKNRSRDSRVCLFDTHTSKTLFHHNHGCICHI